MPSTRGVKRGKADKTMDAVFRAKIAIGILSGDKKGGRADSGFVPFQDIQELEGESADFRIALVHPQKHAGPVMGFRSAGSGMEFQNGVIGIIGPAIEEGLLEFRHFLIQLGAGDFAFLVDVRIVFFLQEFQVFLDRGKLFSKGGFGVDLVVDFAQPTVDFLGLEGILPEAWVGCLCAELVAILLELIEVKDSLASPEAGFPIPC